MTTKFDALQFVRDYALGISEAWATPDGSVAFSRLPLATDELHLNHLFMNEVSRAGSGVRLAFKTDASVLNLGIIGSQLVLPWAGPAALNVDLEINGRLVQTEPITQFETRSPFGVDAETAGKPQLLQLDLGHAGTWKSVAVWLPHNAHSRIVSVQLDGSVAPAEKTGPKWLHYGSSISQASEVDSPSAVWPAVVAKQLGLELRSLGLAGSALLDPFIGPVIVAENPDLVSLKLGINSVNAASHTVRTFPAAVNGLIDSIRAGLPSVPILLISPIFCPPHEEGVGPTIFDPATGKAAASPRPEEFIPSALNLQTIRQQLSAIFANRSKTDSNLYLMDGLDLFGADDANLLPDDLHPNHEGYQLMAARFAASPAVHNWLG